MNRCTAAVLATLALTPALAAEVVKVPATGGGENQMELYLPPAYQEGTPYSVMLSPGGFYWQDQESQPGWIIAVGEPFFGSDLAENSKLAMDWLRARYSPKGGGFHLAGWSANSAGVFEIAMAHPDQILSVTALAGMPGSATDAQLDRIEAIEVHFIVGENDSYWRNGSERWHERMRARGIETTLEIVPAAGHVIQELVGAPIFERLNDWVAARVGRGQ